MVENDGSMDGFVAGAEPFWAVVPAGGSGTRLWPLSRAKRPKFLLPLLGDHSLLQQTIDRMALLTSPQQTLVVCGPGHAAEVARQLPQVPACNVIVEPAPKGSGPAIGLAAALVARRNPNAIMGSFAADHEVRDPVAFAASVATAVEAARTDWLVTIGLTPTRPETGYGYIERTDEAVATTDLGDAYRAARFVEKPDLARAEEYVASGRFLWNASMFIWKAATVLEEMARLQPDLYDGVMRIAEAWETTDQERVTAQIWASLPESTIDQGIMERTDRVAVVPAEMGWSDVGDWHGLGNLIEPDEAGNSVRGHLVQIDSADCAIWSATDRLIALVGLNQVAVIDTPDAVLVVHRSKAQDVRKIVDSLRRLQREELM